MNIAELLVDAERERQAAFIPTTDQLRSLWVQRMVRPLSSSSDAEPGDPEWERHAADHQAALAGFDKWLKAEREAIWDEAADFAQPGLEYDVRGENPYRSEAT